ncbi:hypothetical protein BHM03_00052336 [Ensete ventricosum]|nr:hypothetical protein BHM03_00052336 [Ensete ventricosum]
MNKVRHTGPYRHTEFISVWYEIRKRRRKRERRRRRRAETYLHQFPAPSIVRGLPTDSSLAGDSFSPCGE